MESSEASPDRKNPAGQGLSELSAQLRQLQQKNLSQASVIDKLERQLRILAETKGVSIGDVKSSLIEACQSEAFSELQNEVAVLRDKLEAAQRSNAAKGPSSFEKEAADRTIADLQLRIGELEENEGIMRKEVSGLYKNLKDQTSKATRLEATCARLRENLEKHEERAKMTKQMSTQLVMKAEADAEKEKNAQKVEIDRLKGKVHDAEVQLQMEIDKSKLLEEELDAREKELQLKSDQFNSRFKLQDERIVDLEQQMSSLYTAFGMEEEDRAGEADRRAVLETYLNNADSELAQQIHKVEEKEKKGTLPLSSPSSKAQSASTSTPTLYTTEIKGAADAPQVLLSGWLMKKDKNILAGGWKKRYFALTQSAEGCRLRYSDAPGKKVKGTFGNIVVGRSTVRQTTEYASKWPHAFELRINPHDPQSKVLCAAAPGQRCLDKWIEALRKVTEVTDAEMEFALKASMQEQQMDSAIMASMREQQSVRYANKRRTSDAQDSDMDSAIKASVREQSVRSSGESNDHEVRSAHSSDSTGAYSRRQLGQDQSEANVDMKVAADLYKSGLI